MGIIGIDLGGTKLAGAWFSDDGSMLQRQVLPLAGRQGPAVAALIVEMIGSYRGAGAQAVGISVPGIADVAAGTVWAPNIPGWDYYPLIAQIRTAFPDLQVAMDSDRACYILGESWKGAAKGCRDAIFLAVGTGIGAGILTGGRVLRGSANIAGAVGWMALDRPYDTKYDACGCFEYHASGPGLGKVLSEKRAANAAYRGPLQGTAEELPAEVIFAAYESGDALAIAVLDEAIAYWGMAVANLVSIFNPEKVLFGGGVFGPATQFLARIRAEASRWAQPISMQQVELAAAMLGADAGLVGAGFLAREALSHGTTN
jgi:glucokinase